MYFRLKVLLDISVVALLMISGYDEGINKTKGMKMKINEIIARTPQAVQLQPSVVKRQARVNKVVAQIEASEKQLPPTEDEKVLAMWALRDMKTQTDKQYAQNLRQQLAKADACCKK